MLVLIGRNFPLDRCAGKIEELNHWDRCQIKWAVIDNGPVFIHIWEEHCEELRNAK